MSMKTVTDSAGVVRALGNLGHEGDVLAAAPRVYGDDAATPMIPPTRWPAAIAALDAASPGLDHPDLPPVHDQGEVGQCNAEACTAAAEMARAAQGLPYVALSPADLYARVNGGVDRGSRLPDAMREMTAGGVGTAATSGRLWSPGVRLADDAERARYRALERWLCPTVGHLVSATLSGFPCVTGLLWHDNYHPDAQGWLPERGVGEPGGHAIMAYRPRMRSRRGKAQLGLACLQSWGPGWGLGGRCVVPLSAYSEQVGGWWALRQMTTEPGGLPTPEGAPTPAQGRLFDPETLAGEMARRERIWRGAVHPEEVGPATACMPGGALWLAVLVTDWLGRPERWEVWSTLRLVGWGFRPPGQPGPAGFRPAAPAAAAREAALWLRGRRPGEVRASPGWLALALAGARWLPVTLSRAPQARAV
jgi:hypothetical protein